MTPFPEQYKLEYIFKTEPDVLDVDVPWAYNQPTFTTEAKNGKVKVKIEPGYETVGIVWTQKNRTVLELELIGGLSITIDDDKDLDTLIVTSRESKVHDLVLRVRPFISVRCGFGT